MPDIKFVTARNDREADREYIVVTYLARGWREMLGLELLFDKFISTMLEYIHLKTSIEYPLLP